MMRRQLVNRSLALASIDVLLQPLHLCFGIVGPEDGRVPVFRVGVPRVTARLEQILFVERCAYCGERVARLLHRFKQLDES